MTAKNDITGDALRTKVLSEEDQKKFDENYDKIFGSKFQPKGKMIQLELPLDEYPENKKDA